MDEQDRSAQAVTALWDAASDVVERDPRVADALFFQAAYVAWNGNDRGSLARIAVRAGELRLRNAEQVCALARAAGGQNLDRKTLECVESDTEVGGADALRVLLDGGLDDAGDGGAGGGGRGFEEGLRVAVRQGWWRLLLGDVPAAHALAEELESRCRAQGALGVLCLVLVLLARSQQLLGQHRDAYTTATEGLEIARDTGQYRLWIYQSTVLAHLAAVAGEEECCRELTVEALERDVAPSAVHAAGALGLLDLGLGRPEAALHRLEELFSGRHRQGVFASLPDFVEAAVRSGRPERGQEAYGWYRAWAERIGRSWCRAIAARCAALLGVGDTAPDGHYTDALRLHTTADDSPFERARTELLYGEHLRRAGRRGDARSRLRSAAETFERLAAGPWATRARSELRAAGERAVAVERYAQDHALDRLTPQERQVVRQAANGLSNRDIGARLFLSPRTVGYHLYNAYPKLGVSSRAELARFHS